MTLPRLDTIKQCVNGVDHGTGDVAHHPDGWCRECGQYPEHEKLKAVQAASEAIGEFLDGGLRDQGLVLAIAVEVSGDQVLFPASASIEKILADYFGIDLAKIEAEKRQMLESLRASQ